MAPSPLILVVDDSPVQRAIYSALLRSAGYTVMTAENGWAGVEMALHYTPALILLDVAMPELDGLTVVQELRRHPDMERVPILALTALSEPAERESLCQNGFNDVVDKSGDHAMVLQRIRDWLLS